MASPWCRHAILFHTCILNRSWTGAEQGVCYPIDSWSEANTSGSHHRRSYESNDAMHRVSLQWRYACIIVPLCHMLAKLPFCCFETLSENLIILLPTSCQQPRSRGSRNLKKGAACCKGKLLQIVKEIQTSSQNFLSCFPLQATTLYSDTFCLLPL